MGVLASQWARCARGKGWDIVERYLYTAKRYFLVIAAVFAILLISGSSAAYFEYSNTFESTATVWVTRVSHDLLQVSDSSTDQPTVANYLTPASEYAEVFGQLLQSQTFMTAVVARTSVGGEFNDAHDQLAFLDEVRRRFRVQALGSNLVRITFRAGSAQVAYEMVSGALNERDERAAQQAVGSTAVTTTFYQKEFDLAQQQALRAQQDLDKFNTTHNTSNLNSADDFAQRQLRIASDLALVRLNDLKSRMDRTTVGAALSQLAGGADIQVLDAPQVQPRPSGGLRQAALVFGVMMTGAIVLAGFLVVAGTLLTGSVASEADLQRLGSVALLAAIPRFGHIGNKRLRSDLRTALALAAFGPDETTDVEGAAS